MIRTLNYVTLMVVLIVFSAPWANAEDLSQEYLYGRWVLHEEDCGSQKAEILEFRQDMTFAYIRTGRTEAAGFWEINKGIMDLHMVTSPAFFSDIHRALEDQKGEFDYFLIKLLIFNNNQKSFESFGVLGDEYKRMIAKRCQ